MYSAAMLCTPFRYAFVAVAASCLMAAGCGTDDAESDSSTDAAIDAAADAGGSADMQTQDAAPALPDIGAPRAITFCKGATKSLYQPLDGADLGGFPDDFYTVFDGSRPTRLRPDLTADRIKSLGAFPDGFQAVFKDLSVLDGWGTTADLYMRFSGKLGPLPSGETDSVASDALMLVRLEDPPVRIPYEATVTDEGATVLLSPMVPLLPGRKHALIATSKLHDAAGSCMSPGDSLTTLLEGRAKGDAAIRHTARLRHALETAGVAAKDATAVLAFTTQTIAETSREVAASVAKRTYKWAGPAVCKKASKGSRQCERPFMAVDFRKGRDMSADSKKEWKLAVRFWLPTTKKGADKPRSVVVFGHGLGSGRSQGSRLADFASPLGVVTVAIDSMRHEDHPSGGAEGLLGTVFKFFGISPATLSFDFLLLRDNFRQSTYDKLQLLALLKAHPDLDGDGKTDIDTDRIGYLGVSLGGIMGSELLALTDAIKIAVLSVPGGKVSSIISSSEQFGPLVYAFKPTDTTDGDVDRFFAVLQTLLDRGDGANYAPHVLKNRFPIGGKKPPHVLMQMAIGDDIVPNVATRALARAMAIPHVGKVIQPIGIVPIAPKPPFAANVGGITAGLFQFDRTRKNKGAAVKKCTHSSTPSSFEAFEQDKRFMMAWQAGGKAEIIDPYAELKTPPL